MKSQEKVARPRNYVAKDLWSGKYKQRVVSLKKAYKRKYRNQKEGMIHEDCYMF